jgi:Iron-containing alcohol dehydrogenase
MPCLLDELSISRPLLIRTERWHHVQVPVHDRFHGARAQSEISGVKAAREAASSADGLIALGGGSAIDAAKAAEPRDRSAGRLDPHDLLRRRADERLRGARLGQSHQEK